MHQGSSLRTALVAGLGVVAVVAVGATAASARAQVELRVDATRELGPVNTDVYGGNLEYIDAARPELDDILALTPLVRFPGGDADSVFVWDRTGPGDCGDPLYTWPAAAEAATRLGFAFFLETNIVRSSPAQVVSWLEDAERRGVSVSWIDIGNEVWGPWDAGYRSPEQYADDLHQHADAIRARYPDARIVAEIGTFNEDAWNRRTVRLAADVIDAVDYHFYPNHHELDRVDAMQVVAGAEAIPLRLADLRAMLREEAGDRADHIGILVGEWDGAADPPTGNSPVPGEAYLQWSVANALFWGSALGELLVGGVAGATFYEVQGYRFGAIGGNYCSPPDDYAVRRPKVLALELYRRHFGDRLVETTLVASPTFHSDGPTNWDGFSGDAPYVRAYASLTTDGSSLRIVAVNRHPTDALPVTFDLAGFSPGATARTFVVAGDALDAVNENVGGPGDRVRIEAGEVPVAGPRFVYEAPAHSVTALELDGVGAPPGPDAGLPGDDGGSPVVDGGPPAGDGSPRLELDSALPRRDAGAGGDDDGCGCRVVGRATGRAGAGLGALALAGWLLARRARRRRRR